MFGDAAQPARTRPQGGPRRHPGHEHVAGAGGHLADRPSAPGRTRAVQPAAGRTRRPAPELRPGPGPAAARRDRRGGPAAGFRRVRRPAPRGEPGGPADRARGRPDRAGGPTGHPAAAGAELRETRTPAGVHPGRPRPDHQPGRGGPRAGRRGPATPWWVCAPVRWPPSGAWCSPRSPRTTSVGTRRPCPRRGPTAPARRCWRCCPAAQNLIPVWEALDLAGCISRWLPCWDTIRARPQHNPIHLYTVDRHSVQTVVEAQRHLTRVDRPDILLLTALLHDIGKIPGAATYHAAVGAPIARDAVLAIGLDRGGRRSGGAAGSRAPDPGPAGHQARPRRSGHPGGAGRGRAGSRRRAGAAALPDRGGRPRGGPGGLVGLAGPADQRAGRPDRGSAGRRRHSGRRDPAGRPRDGPVGAAGRSAPDPARAPPRRDPAGGGRAGPARPVQRHRRPAGLPLGAGAFGRAAHRRRAWR